MSLKNIKRVSPSLNGGALISLPEPVSKGKKLMIKPRPTILDNPNNSINTPDIKDEEEYTFNKAFDKLMMNQPTDLPISSTNEVEEDFEGTWANINDEKVSSFGRNNEDQEMMCVDPFAAEGKVPSIPPSKTLPKLNLDTPHGFQESQISTPTLDTPECDNALGDTGFDLLEFLNNETISIDDPSFQSFLEPLGSNIAVPVIEDVKPDPITLEAQTWNIPVGNKMITMDIPVVANNIDDGHTDLFTPGPGKRLITPTEKTITTIDMDALKEEDEDPDYVPETRPPVKRGPGRPRVPRVTPLSLERPIGKRARGRPPGSVGKRRTSTITSAADISDHAYNIVTYDSTSGNEDIKDVKYRRMRDLNNLASKRCRQKRRNKMEQMVYELEIEEEKNKNLKIKYKQMKELVDKLKEKFLTQVANPQQKLATTAVVVQEVPQEIPQHNPQQLEFEHFFDQQFQL